MADGPADPMAIGRELAEQVLARRKIARARRAEALAAHPAPTEMRVEMTTPAGLAPAVRRQTAGFLLAAGDSWFDYPLHDVLKLLEDHYGYNVESAAHSGDPVESMAYQGGQIDKFARCLEKVTDQGGVPKAVLLSGGGDDIAGNEFGMLLNSARSNISGWNDEVVDGVINRRIATALKTMFSSITVICQRQIGAAPPLLVHGYDYPVPDGRGFLGGWPFPGPWLEPGFREKLFADLAAAAALMREIIDRFNTMLVALVSDPALSNVHYINLRGTLSSVLDGDAYQEWWANELHPTEKGFSAIADKFAAELGAL
jgi:hypothetical protein